MVRHNCCPVCNSYDIRLLFICTDHFKSREEFPVFTCSVCAFTFTQDHPDENVLGNYYDSDDYISHTDSSQGLLNKIYRSVRTIMLRSKKNLVKSTTTLETGTLLDIGSGTGHFGAEMKKAGWIFRGIEINEKARKISSERFGLNIIPPGEINSLEPGYFDCITLWHVLEHFNDLNKYITEISRLMKPGGTCIIALPNIDSYDARHYKRYWAAFDVPRHLWHFSPDTFGFLFEGRGFRITETDSLPLDVFYISILSEKYKGSLVPFIKGMSVGAFFAFKALFNKRKSSSLIYILRK